MKTKLLLSGLIVLFAAVFLIFGGESAIAQTDQPAGVPLDQIIIKYKDAANLNQAAEAQSDTQMQRLSDAAGVKIAYFRPMSGDAHVLQLPELMPVDRVLAITDQLSTLPEVEYAEPDYIMFPLGESINTPSITPNDPQYNNQWHYFAPGAGHYGVNAPAAWDITTGSSNIYVAVLDTGITNHADLNGRWVGGYDMITNAFVGNDGDGRDNDPHDPGDWVTTNECGYIHSPDDSSWHGTHVAGTIGAATNNNRGVAGLNWVSRVVPVRVLGKCGGSTSDIADAVRWAAGLSVSGVPANPYPAKVLNLSLGGSGACENAMQNAVNAARGAGSVIVVAAGNNNDNAGGYTPASCANVITIAATDRDGDRAYYSNYGSTVEISGPGGAQSYSNDPNGVLSTLNNGTTVPATGNYEYYQGTSMAAPHVAGIASLMLSVNPALSPAEVLSFMQSTVTAFPGGSTCNTSICGSGIVNAANAVAAAQGTLGPPAPVLSPIENADGDGNYTVSWSAGSFASQADEIANTPLSVTDVYTIYLPLVMRNYDGTVFTLQEDDNMSFASPTEVYMGTGTSWNATGKAAGIYYYRVMASNDEGDSAWSNIESVIVGSSSPGIVNGNFESGTTGWIEFSTHGWDIIVDTFPTGITPRSGVYAAWLGGDYDDISYVQQQVTVSASTPYLVYWHWIASEDVCGFDFGSVKVNTIVVDSYNLCATEDTGTWVRHSVDLSAYAGQSVALQIRAETDSSLNSNLFVDDVSLAASASGSDPMDGTFLNFDPATARSRSGIVIQGEKP